MPKKLRNLCLGLLLIVGFSLEGFSQGVYQGFTNYHWYFGNSSFNIGFNKGNPQNPYVDSVMSTPYGIAGSGVGLDQITGALLFYSDGSTVYDASHQSMPGATAQPAVSANQGVAVSPVPGNDTQYYIFTINGSGDLDYSVVDMTLPGNPPTQFGGMNLGDVSTWRQNLPGNVGNNVSDAMVIVQKSIISNGYWLITQEPNTAIYKVIDINSSGIGAETSFNLTTQGAVSINAAHFGIHPSGKLIVSPKEAGKNIQLLDFNNFNGTVSFDQLVLNTATNDPAASEAIYDAALNPGMDILFVSKAGFGTEQPGLIAYDLTNPGNSPIPLFTGTLARSYGLKYGPNNILYHIYQETTSGPFLIGRIDNPGGPIDSLTYSEQIFQLRNFGGRQFPAVLPPKIIMPDIPIFMNIGTCVSDTVWFFADMDPFTSQFRWNFDDMNFPGDQFAVSPGYNYSAPGGYNVSVTTTVGGQSITSAPLMINIQQTQLMIDLGQDTVICPGEQLLLEIDAQVYPQLQNVVWSTGESDVQSITISEGGNYWVSGVDVSTGCNLDDAIRVDEYGLNVTIGNIWYFGNNAGLDFNQNPPLPLDDGAMVAPEGCAAYSDRNGDILFYTDGQTVYNPSHLPMANGNGDLIGDPGASQSTLIVQFPSDETLYYVFSNACTNPLVTCNSFQLSYSIVDLKAIAGGDVVVKNKPLFKNSTERITAVSFGLVTWLLAHEFGTNSFRAYPISELGIGAPVISSVGSVHDKRDGLQGDGYMKLSSDGTRVAVAYAKAGRNVVELFDFDATTGVISNPLELDMNDTGGKVYGVEFSPNSNWLYATLSNIGSGAQSKIYQWHVDSTTLAGNVTDPGYIMNSIAVIPGGTTTDALGAIQISPTGGMYVAVNGASFLGTINNPDGLQNGTTTAFGDLNNGQPLAAGTTSALGLPNFVQNLSSQTPPPSMGLQPTACVDELINFSATTTSIIDMFDWSIFNSSGALVSSSANQADTIRFTIPDDYVFSVRIYNRCLDPIAILTDTIQILPNPLDPFGLIAVPICDQSVTLTPYNADPHPEYDYLWSTGETTQDLTVSSIGTYNLVITDPIAGCINNFDVFVGPPFTVDLGPDLTICESDSLTLDSQANADDYIWELINGGVATPITGFETSRFLPLSALQPPNPVLVPGMVNTIAVGVIDPVNPVCIVRDTIDITVNSLPPIVVLTADATGCGLADGQITIAGSALVDYVYTITGPSGVFMGQIPVGAGPITVSPLPGGTYVVDITDGVTGCTSSQGGFIIVEDPGFNILVPPVTTDDGCDPANPSGTITITIDANLFPIDYIVTDQATNAIVQTGNANELNPGNLDFIITGVPAGTYVVEVNDDITNMGSCSDFVPNVIVGQLPSIDLQGPLTMTECGTQVLFSPAFFFSSEASALIEWSVDGTTYQDASTVPFTTFGTTNVFIRASDTSVPIAFCDSIQNVQITLTPQPTVTIDSVLDCSGFVTLTANANSYPGAIYNYQWFSGSQPTSISALQSINVTVNDFYYVVVSHANNLGCFFQSDPPVPITVPIPITLNVASTPACTGAEFTVSAVTFRDDLTYRWFIDGVAQPETDQSIKRTNLPGLYRAEATDLKGCTQFDELQIILNQTTLSDILPLYTICFDDVGLLEIDPGGPYVSYIWSNRNTGLVIDTTPTFTTLQAGEFQADLTNGFQCVTSDAFDVIEDCVPKIFGPNAIRPTSSIPENKIFFLNTEYIQNFEIFLHNRWGELIFYSGEKDFTWDGTQNSVPLPNGSYTYVVKYTKEFGGNGETLTHYGGVTIIR